MFEAFNESGNLQFNAESSVVPFFLFSKETVTSNIGWPAGSSTPTMKYVIVSCDINDIIAVSCSTTRVTTFFETDTCYVVTDGVADVTVYRFKRFVEGTAGTSGTGMEVFDPTGTRTFSTDASLGYGKTLRFVQFYPVTSMTSGYNQAVSLPAGRTYAFVTNNHSIRETANTNGQEPTFNLFTNQYTPAPNGAVAGVQTTAGGMQLNEMPGATYTNGNKFDGGIMVVDVTGY